MKRGAGEGKAGGWRLVVLGLMAVLLPGVGLLLVGWWLGEGGGIDARSVPLWTVAAFLVVAGVVLGLALVPSHLTSLAAGFLYGPGWGLVGAMGAVGVGTVVGWWLARRLAQDELRRLIDRSGWGRVLADDLLEGRMRRVIGVITLARLPPQVPFALGTVLGASARVGVWSLVAGTVLGMLPRAGLVVWVGAALGQWEPTQPVPGELVWTVVLAVVGFGGLMVWGAMVLRRKQRERRADLG